MLRIAGKFSELDFDKLMTIYEETNRRDAAQRHPQESEYRSLAMAESDFRQYLMETFFRTKGAYYAIWEHDGTWVSALRMEPYRDGVLLTALETAPEYRGRGFGRSLVTAVLAQCEVPVYSHVEKKNAASLHVHKKCGFQVILDYAVYLDGSVLPGSFTMCHKALKVIF